MSDQRSPQPGEHLQSGMQPAGNSVVYVIAPEEGGPEDELDLVEVFGILWRGRWLITAACAVFAAASTAYALLATEWYRAEVLLAPTEEMSTQGIAAQLGGLAGLAGISVGASSSVEPVAVLQSRDFTRDFIEEQELLQVLLADQWDPSANRWKGDDPAEWPDARDAVKYFDEKVRTVTEDKVTGLVTLEIRWTDRDLAASWANLLAQRLNDRMRQRALVEAERNVEYLQTELATTNIVTLNQTIGRLLESELQKLMIARGNEEFSFRIIDSAEIPKERSSPKRTLIVAVMTFLGGVLASVAVLLRGVATRRRGVATETSAGQA